MVCLWSGLANYDSFLSASGWIMLCFSFQFSKIHNSWPAVSALYFNDEVSFIKIGVVSKSFGLFTSYCNKHFKVKFLSYFCLGKKERNEHKSTPVIP